MYALLRIRSPRSKSVKVEDTLKKLRLNKVNHSTIVPENKTYDGMIKRIQNVVTWGEVDKDTLAKLIRYRSTLNGDVEERLKEETSYENVEEFAEAVISGDVELTDVDGLKNLFRLHPPRGGYRSIKKPYKTGGSLGYRGQKINELLQRMLGPENMTEE